MEEKYYTRSSGERVKISEMNFEHLTNAYKKMAVNVFEAVDEEDYFNRINALKDIQDGIYGNFNKFYDERYKKGDK